MKYVLITVIIFLFAGSIEAQINQDSVLNSITQGKTYEEQFRAVSKELNKYNSDNLHNRLFFARALVDIATKSGDTLLMGKAYYDLGYSYEIIGQLDLGIDACFTALDYVKKSKDMHTTAMIYNEIGLTYSFSENESDLTKAIEYFNKFLHIQQERKDTAEIAGALSNIGLMYIYLGDADSSYYYSKRALDLRLMIDQKRTIPISYGNVGISLFQMGKKDSALYYYQKSAKAFVEMGNRYGLNETYRNLITYYIDQNNPQKVKEYVDKSFENAKKIESLHLTRMAYLGKYDYNKMIGNYEDALRYFEIYKKLSDSLKNERTEDRIANVEAVYKLDQNKKEIALLREKEKLSQQEEVNRKQRLTFIIIVASLIVLILFIISLYIVRKHKQENIVHKIKNKALEQEKALTQSKLEESKLKERELNTQLEYKSKQLTTHALNMMKKNKFLQELESDISEIRKEAGEDVKAKLRRINSLIKRNNKSDKDWELFKNYFEEVNKGFYERLANKYPGLSSNDFKLCALIKLNMNIKESASVLNISPESVKTARYRLRKKLNLEAEDDLHEVITHI